jgi:aromatic ring-opening dioxygenase LigB subunit
MILKMELTHSESRILNESFQRSQTDNFLNETTLVMHPGGLHQHKRMQLIRKKILEGLIAERRKKVPSCKNFQI